MYFYFPHKSCLFALPSSKAEPWSSMPREKGAGTAWDREALGRLWVWALTSFTSLERHRSPMPAFVEKRNDFFPEVCPLINQRPTLVDLIINVYTGRTTIKTKGGGRGIAIPSRGALWEEEKDKDRKSGGERCVSWQLQTSRQGDGGNIQSRRQASDPILVWPSGMRSLMRQLPWNNLFVYWGREKASS